MAFFVTFNYKLGAFALTMCLAQFAFASPQPSARFKAECENQLPPTSIVVEIQPSAVKYNFELGIAGISAKNGQLSTSSQATVGLTESHFRLATNWGGETLQDVSSKLICTRPALKVEVSVGPQTVFVAKEFPKDTCAFWEIANHELRHVRTNQAHAEVIAADLERALKHSFKNRVFYGTPEALKKAFTDNLSNDWLPWGRARFDTVEKQHAVIDSPAEYARTALMCDGQVSRELKLLPSR